MAPGLALNLLIFLLFLLFTAPAWAQGPQSSEVAGAVGGVALLNPQSLQNPSKFSQIHWRWQNQLKIASWKKGEQPMYLQGRFEGRLELLENGTLRMSNLSLGDGGEYRLYLEEDTGRESVHRVLLRVYDLVPKPRVTATTNGDPQVCNTTLSCSVALPGVTYEWIPPQKAPMKEGPVLEVSVSPAVETYVCRVSNPVSSSNASLTLRRPCSWTDESSSSSSSAACAMPSAPAALGHLVLLVLLFLLLAAA
ncbi:SLAM family member 9-like [Camarhynchus parvulus]|uniref:SLAM family member 9-like n=1 Tax=Geospiza parvula TaxID=87175 RepID=UPI001237F775|nr:SLAM family member 9-like [Camarhynchus parvulus]